MGRAFTVQGHLGDDATEQVQRLDEHPVGENLRQGPLGLAVQGLGVVLGVIAVAMHFTDTIALESTDEDDQAWFTEPLITVRD